MTTPIDSSENGAIAENEATNNTSDAADSETDHAARELLVSAMDKVKNDANIHDLLQVKLLHSSQFLGLCSTKSSSETLQNLPYFICMKTQSCFFRFSFRAILYFPQMSALVYVDCRPCLKFKFKAISW